MRGAGLRSCGTSSLLKYSIFVLSPDVHRSKWNYKMATIWIVHILYLPRLSDNYTSSITVQDEIREMSKKATVTDHRQPMAANENHSKQPQCLHKSNITRNTVLFVCVAVLRPSQPNGVMSSAVSLPNHMFTGQA